MFVWTSGFQKSLAHTDFNMFVDEWTRANESPDLVDWILVLFLLATTKLGQGNIFTSVCQEFCTHGGSASVHAGMHPPSRHPPGADTPRPDTTNPPGADTTPWEQTPPPGPEPPPGTDPPGADTSIRSTSGRYASYWNAFLFWLALQLSMRSHLCEEKKKLGARCT